MDRAALPRLARTVRHLRPSQVPWRVVRLATQALVGRVPAVVDAGRGHECAPGWPAGFAPLPAGDEVNVDDVAEGRFRLLAEERALGLPIDWSAPGAAQLWRFHLHYWDWARHLPDSSRPLVAELWRSWADASPVGRGDAWSPYVVATRAWSLAAAYAELFAGGPVAARVVESLHRHERLLRLVLEHDIGGNHLVRDYKALVGLAAFRGDRGLTARRARAFTGVLARQLLADGGHEERTASYHAQVLGDALDVAGLLAALGIRVEGLEASVARMQAWLGAVLLADGDVPQLNDAALVGQDRLRALGVEPAPPDVLRRLDGAGLVRVALGRLDAVLDVGLPCPPHLPAHAHADSLTFELLVDGARVLVDGGTSEYGTGPVRAVERSTAAHNTVVVDGEDSTEVWGAFRAGRRARTVVEECVDGPGGVRVVACHDGYRHLSGQPVHRRTWRFEPGRLVVEDEVLGAGEHEVRAWLHVAPVLAVERHDPSTVQAGPVTITVQGARLELHEPGSHPVAWAATGFGRRRPAWALEVVADGRLPRRVTTVVRAGAARPAPYDRRP